MVASIVLAVDQPTNDRSRVVSGTGKVRRGLRLRAQFPRGHPGVLDPHLSRYSEGSPREETGCTRVPLSGL